MVRVVGKSTFFLEGYYNRTMPRKSYLPLTYSNPILIHVSSFLVYSTVLRVSCIILAL